MAMWKFNVLICCIKVHKIFILNPINVIIKTFISNNYFTLCVLHILKGKQCF